MNIQTIKCTDGYFVKSELGKYLRFGNETVSPTWKQDWFKVSDVSGKTYKVIPARDNTTGFKLKDEYSPTEAMPAEVPATFFSDGMEHLYQLYSRIIEEIPESYEEIDGEIDVIAEIEGELVEKYINIPVYGTWSNEGKRWSVTNQRVQVSLMDEITLPDILKQEAPCELSSEDSYKIIRTHVKDNINPKVAKLASDYDFCLTVEKKIPLTEKREYTVDENAWSGMFGGRRKKPKVVTKYQVERGVKVYETAPRINGKVYSGYTETPKFRGTDTADLKENIDTFLEALMEEINRPLKDCPTCKGHGVIETNND